jgi:hypothetical protein
MISCRADLFKVHKERTMIVPLDVYFDFLESKPNHFSLNRIDAKIDARTYREEQGEMISSTFDLSQAGSYAEDKRKYVIEQCWLWSGKVQKRIKLPTDIHRCEGFVFNVRQEAIHDPRIKLAEVWGTAIIEREDGAKVNRITMHVEVE